MLSRCGVWNGLSNTYNINNVSFSINNLESGNGSVNDINYLVFQNTKLQWRNIDAFMNLPKNQLVAVTLPSKYDASRYSFKLVFKNLNIIYPTSIENDAFVFPKVPKDTDAILVAMAYINNIPMLCIKEINTNSKIKSVDFKEVSVEEIQKKLKRNSKN